MENEILKICALAVLCAVLGAVVGKIAGVQSAVKIAGLAAVLGGVLGLLSEAVELLRVLGGSENVSEYTAIMLRGLGIAVLCRLCSDICRDCGEATVALAVESAGKIGMVILAMPALYDIVEIAVGLADRL